MLTDAHELMDRGQSTEDCVVADHHMAGERRIIRHDDVVAQAAIVRDMSTHHEEAAVSNLRQHAAAARAWVHGDVLTHDIAPTDLQAGFLALILQVLRSVADRGEREDASVGADDSAASHYHVRDKFDSVLQLDLGADHAIRPDARGFCESCPRLDHGRRMNAPHCG